MIPKSGPRFSDKIMLDRQKTESIFPTVINKQKVNKYTLVSPYSF